MTPELQVEVEIKLASHPLVIQFSEQGGDKPQTGYGVGEDVGDPGAAPRFSVEVFQAAHRTQPHTMDGREVKRR